MRRGVQRKICSRDSGSAQGGKKRDECAPVNIIENLFGFGLFLHGILKGKIFMLKNLQSLNTELATDQHR